MTDEPESRVDYFDRIYRIVDSPARRAVERRVLDSDYGANGYTTLAQAMDMTRRLEVGSQSLLLDIGSGSGWPALKTAAETGCRAVLTDLPAEGLRTARRRAIADGIRDRVVLVRSAGAPLPFRDGTFDAVMHSDVLC